MAATSPGQRHPHPYGEHTAARLFWAPSESPERPTQFTAHGFSMETWMYGGKLPPRKPPLEESRPLGMVGDQQTRILEHGFEEGGHQRGHLHLPPHPDGTQGRLPPLMNRPMCVMPFWGGTDCRGFCKAFAPLRQPAERVGYFYSQENIHFTTVLQKQLFQNQTNQHKNCNLIFYSYH